MTPAPEKAAPIPAVDALRKRVQSVNEESADMLDAWFAEHGSETSRSHWKKRALVAEAALADRDSQEERIREDERDRLYEEAVRRMSEPDFMDDNEAAFVQRFLSRLGAMQPIDRARQRGDAS